jgi:hypothetical protein
VHPLGAVFGCEVRPSGHFPGLLGEQVSVVPLRESGDESQSGRSMLPGAAAARSGVESGQVGDGVLRP